MRLLLPKFGSAIVGVIAIGAASLLPGLAAAQSTATITGTVEPTIWIDPDGCMHWAADGGVEGYMEGRVNPQNGMPVCLDMNTCSVENLSLIHI